MGDAHDEGRHIGPVVNEAQWNKIQGLIEKGIASGAFRAMDASVATQITLDAVNGILRWYRPGGRLSRDDAIAEVVAHIDAALSK